MELINGKEAQLPQFIEHLYFKRFGKETPHCVVF